MLIFGLVVLIPIPMFTLIVIFFRLLMHPAILLVLMLVSNLPSGVFLLLH